MGLFYSKSSAYSWIALPQWYIEGSREYGKKGFLQNSKLFKQNDVNNMKGKVCLITGANQGIGYAAAEGLAKLDATVHLLCRNQERAENAMITMKQSTNNPNIYYHIVDSSDFQDVKNFCNGFLSQHKKVDVFVHNAGALQQKYELTKDNVESCMAIMLGGTYLMTSLLMPGLNNSDDPRVINVSSGGAYTVKMSVEDFNSNQSSYDGTRAYAHVKRVQNILSSIMAEKYPNVQINSMHPGWTETQGVIKSLPGFSEKQKQSGNELRSLDEGADTIVWMAASDSIKNISGKFFFDRKQVRENLPMAGTQESTQERQQLWNQVVKYCGTFE